jgi:hypothetical protein
MWEDAIRLATRYNPETVNHLRQRYLTWLRDTRQMGLAGSFVESEGKGPIISRIVLSSDSKTEFRFFISFTANYSI